MVCRAGTAWNHPDTVASLLSAKCDCKQKHAAGSYLHGSYSLEPGWDYTYCTDWAQSFKLDLNLTISNFSDLIQMIGLVNDFLTSSIH